MTCTDWKARALEAEAELAHLDRVLARWPALAGCASRTDAVVLACCLDGESREQARHWQREAKRSTSLLDQQAAQAARTWANFLWERRQLHGEIDRLRRFLYPMERERRRTEHIDQDTILSAAECHRQRYPATSNVQVTPSAKAGP